MTIKKLPFFSQICQTRHWAPLTKFAKSAILLSQLNWGRHLLISYMTLTRPNSRVLAALVAAVFGASALGGVLYKTFVPTAARAGAEYTYASEPQWYNGPVAHPVLSGKNMAFVTLWEGNGLNLYVTDLDAHKDSKITINQSLSAGASLPSITENYISWMENRNNKYQVNLFERFNYTTNQIADSMNQIGRPATDGSHVVWAEANDDSFGSKIRSYNISSTNLETLASGGWVSNPVIAGKYAAWFQTTASCNSLAYRLCRPDEAVGNMVVYDFGSRQLRTVAQNVIVKYDPTMTETRLIWTQKFGTQYDLVQYDLTNSVTTRLTNTDVTEAYPVTSNGRVAFLAIPPSGYPRIANVLDLNTNVVDAMPYAGYNQEYVTISGNRVAWQEVRTDSRIYIYDFTKPNAAATGEQDFDHDGLTLSQETAAHTSDMNVDSDHDGIPDTDEVVLYGTNPSAMDSDGDGLTDYEELFYYKTNPMKFDTDGDGYNDGLEVKSGYSPLNPHPVKVTGHPYEWTAKARPLTYNK